MGAFGLQGVDALKGTGFVHGELHVVYVYRAGGIIHHAGEGDVRRCRLKGRGVGRGHGKVQGGYGDDNGLCKGHRRFRSVLGDNRDIRIDLQGVALHRLAGYPNRLGNTQGNRLGGLGHRRILYNGTTLKMHYAVALGVDGDVVGGYAAVCGGLFDDGLLGDGGAAEDAPKEAGEAAVFADQHHAQHDQSKDQNTGRDPEEQGLVHGKAAAFTAGVTLGRGATGRSVGPIAALFPAGGSLFLIFIVEGKHILVQGIGILDASLGAGSAGGRHRGGNSGRLSQVFAAAVAKTLPFCKRRAAIRTNGTRGCL